MTVTVSPTPQPILDAQAAVQADADQIAADKVAKALTAASVVQAQTALVAAQQADAGADAVLVADRQHLATDLAALLALETQTYSGL